MTKEAPTPPNNLAEAVAPLVSLAVSSVRAVLHLLEQGATVPFIARYRKEATGSLDEQQIRAIEEAATRVLELQRRRATILRSLDQQGIDDPKLLAAIAACDDRKRLEDLYLPHKPKRRTKAVVARELGLDPLAQRIMEQPRSARPHQEVRSYLGEGCASAEQAWQGAQDIVVEWLSEDPETRAELRTLLSRRGAMAVQPTKGTDPDSKFRDYFGVQESIPRLKGHRYLAMRRGEAEGHLRVSLDVDDRLDLPARIARRHGLRPGSPYAEHLQAAAGEAWRKRLRPSLVKEIRGELDERFDLEAVEVFADNLQQLLLAPPLGAHAVIGIDPGLRTGCKCVVVDETGKLLDHAVLHLTGRRGQEAVTQLEEWMNTHAPQAIAVGNGTGGREAMAFVRSKLGRTDACAIVAVNEAGASVYSASEVAREEFPDLDLTIRGAVSIARRLQDPLSALVEIEPKAIGVGQYQHDVPPALLDRRLSAVVEDCVNRVGVAVNSASAGLLSHVAGIGPKQAKAIVAHRDEHGAFAQRTALKKVAGMGPKKFEQCAGFLRIPGSRQPLDDSAVHPERYALVEKIARDQGIDVRSLIGQRERLKAIDRSAYAGDGVGPETLDDIFDELSEPGRDPRQEFSQPGFRDDVTEPEDLEVGMKLHGVVTNVTAFGAFVDVGVHQDGLIHISKLRREFVARPADVVKVGQAIEVWVLDVDLRRRRIALSALEPD